VRVVSLVPAVTETLRALGADPIACTRFCEQPDLPAVGGTKNPDIAQIVTLRPELVVVNDEENRREDAEAIAAAGIALHSMSPRSVAEVGPAVTALAGAVGAVVPAPFGPPEWVAWLDDQADARATPARTAATLVWRRPWMTMSGDTYGSSLLAVLGFENVFAPEPDRYPEVSLDDVRAKVPALVLLPSEPYAFAERHAAEVGEALPDARALLVDGRDLFWWGVRTPDAVRRLRQRIR
jgi:ABC-type Fe3+-hydroxamate transport system substrate-binding protein